MKAVAQLVSVVLLSSLAGAAPLVAESDVLSARDTEMFPGMLPGLGGMGGGGGANPFVPGNGAVDGVIRLVNGLLGQERVGGRDVNQADMFPGMMGGLTGMLGGGGSGGGNPFNPGNGVVDGVTRLVNGLLGNAPIGGRDATDAVDVERRQYGVYGQGDGLVDGLTRLVNGLLGQGGRYRRDLNAQQVSQLEALRDRLQQYQQQQETKASSDVVHVERRQYGEYGQGDGLVDGLTRLVNGLLGQSGRYRRDLNTQQVSQLEALRDRLQQYQQQQQDSSKASPERRQFGGQGNGLIDGIIRLINGLLGQGPIRRRQMTSEEEDWIRSLLERLQQVAAQNTAGNASTSPAATGSLPRISFLIISG
ncbi:hypothetical protein D9613_000865 [Agrocybe pediades]|uniref:Uncharacterized protein n=1 Tax=Agrocybe pediades TaxID=84607 RepID=A0A8H4VSQ2_9AGAR|nr:hypothetical protein D9613_000865 [Agrocybe pediades]